MKVYVFIYVLVSLAILGYVALNMR